MDYNPKGDGRAATLVAIIQSPWAGVYFRITDYNGWTTIMGQCSMETGYSSICF